MPARVSLIGVPPERPRDAQEVHDGDGHQRTGEGEPDVLPDLPGAKEGNAHDHGEGCARVDAQDPGIGQRVAGQRLDQRTGESQRDAHQQAGEGPRGPEVDDAAWSGVEPWPVSASMMIIGLTTRDPSSRLAARTTSNSARAATATGDAARIHAHQPGCGCLPVVSAGRGGLRDRWRRRHRLLHPE